MRGCRCAILALLTLGMLALAGCPRGNQAPSADTTSDTARPVKGAANEDGEQITAGALPEHWPAEFTLYPGAKVIEGCSRVEDGVLRLKVLLESGDPGQDVGDYYAKLAAQEGFQIVSSSRVERKWLSVYQHGQRNFAVTVEEGEGTRAELDLTGVIPAPRDDSGSKDDADSGRDKPEAPDKPDNPGSGKDERQQRSEHPLLPLYPGAESQGLVGEAGMTSVNMTTDDDGEKVQAFYRRFYEGRGFEQLTSFDFGTQVSTSFTGPEGEVNVVTGSVPANEAAGEPERTMIYLSYKLPPAPAL